MTSIPEPKDTGQAANQQWDRDQYEVWQKRARDYGNLDWVAKRDFVDALVQFCDPQPHWAALDLGTGPGIIAAAVHPHVAATIGIDISDAMIALAKDELGHVENLDFTYGDVQDLPYPDGQFDLITARMVFHHVADCEDALSETLRVLRPGARFVLCEGVPPDHRVRERYESIFALKEKRHTFSEAELINLLDRAGYVDITLKPHFMRQVSMNNWLENGALAPEVIAEIRRLHVEADDHFKSVYRLNERDGDVFMDWKFVMVRGIKAGNP